MRFSYFMEGNFTTTEEFWQYPRNTQLKIVQIKLPAAGWTRHRQGGRQRIIKATETHHV